MVCKICGIDKDAEYYYLCNKSVCKKCCIDRVAKYIKEHPEKRRIYLDKLNKKRRGKQTEYYRLWYKKNGRKIDSKSISYINNWKKNNKDKMSIYSKLSYYIKKGKIIKPNTCSVCGRNDRIYGHHPDYNKPLNVVWLCASCHKKEHNRLACKV